MEVNNKEASIEEIKRSLSDYNAEMLKDITAYVLKTYVVDKGINFENISENVPATVSQNEVQNEPSMNSFRELVSWMKNKYDFPELDLFTADAGGVFIRLNGSKQEIKSSERPVENTKEKPVIKNTELSPKKSFDENPHRFKNLERDD